jgi:LTXXQ motif family protein
MNKMIVAGIAVAAGFAIASPMLAWSAPDSGAPATQAAPAQPAMGPGGGAWQGGGRGPMAWHRGWMRDMMLRRMARLSPRQRCDERLARRAGMIAYTIAKLDLTPQQKPLWDKLNGRLQSQADKERRLCASLKQAAGQQTILDRVGQRERFLAARLQGLQQIRPALEQFYQGLSTEQKAIIDHPFRRG